MESSFSFASSKMSITWTVVPQPLPTNRACWHNFAINGVNMTGISRQVCQVNVRPDDANITSCCNSGAEVRIRDNCKQWCEADDIQDFFGCLNEMLGESHEYVGGTCELAEDVLASVSSSTGESADETGTSATEEMSTSMTEEANNSRVEETGTSATEPGDQAEETGTNDRDGDDDEGTAAGRLGQLSFAVVGVAITMAVGLLSWLL